MSFSVALERVLKHEGGYVNDPSDPGGETNYGITVAVARANGYQGPMKIIPISLVQKIYKQSYWDACQCDSLPPSVAYQVFDSAVNQGVRQSSKFLQRALKIGDDGVIGPKTLACARQMKPEVLNTRFYIERMGHYTKIKGFSKYGRGWSIRALDVLAESLNL